MPILELESTISSLTSSPASTRPHVNTRMENSTVHAEPPSTTNMDTTLESREATQNQPTPSKLPFLRESLRPITLKVQDMSFDICSQFTNISM